MLVLDVHYLTGRAVATEHDSYRTVEWPPHPSRLYSALVAALHEGNFSLEEREALLWLERLQPPAVHFAQIDGQRTAVDCYVPVNDQYGPAKGGTKFSDSQVKEGLSVLPSLRSRQVRYFPSATVPGGRACFSWATDEVRHVPALERLCDAVSYLGHSSSLVAIHVRSTLPKLPDEFLTIEPLHDPMAQGDYQLRVPARGRLEALERLFESKNRPDAGPVCTYAVSHLAAEGLVRSRFEQMLVFTKADGLPLGLRSTVPLVQAVRGTIMSRAEQPPREILTGHAADGSHSLENHVAIVPLANVGSTYSDGVLMGFGVVLPRGISSEDRDHVRHALRCTEEEPISLRIDGNHVWRVAPLSFEDRRYSLQPARYRGPSLEWATTSPFVFDRFPKRKEGWTDEDLVRQACERAGLPRPSVVGIDRIPFVRGVPPSSEFEPLPVRPGKPRRPFAHLYLRFDQPIVGPVLLGAGRFQGFGLCVPVPGRYRPEPEENAGTPETEQGGHP